MFNFRFVTNVTLPRPVWNTDNETNRHRSFFIRNFPRRVFSTKGRSDFAVCREVFALIYAPAFGCGSKAALGKGG